MRDQRDPQAYGETLLRVRRESPTMRLSEVQDASNIGCIDFDAEHVGPLEKYGDPRERHRIQQATDPGRFAIPTRPVHEQTVRPIDRLGEARWTDREAGA